MMEKNNTQFTQQLGRIIAGSYYDHQEVRITEFNRIRDIIRRKIEDIPLVGGVEEKKDDKDKFKQKFVDKEIPKYLAQLVADKKLTEKEEYYVVKILEVQKNAEKYEKEYQVLMQEYVESQDIYNEFLLHIRGISSVLSANLIKEFAYCEEAPHISSLWKYCGMHVTDGRAPVRKKGEKLEFNAKLRTMVWKISDSFVKQRTPFYRDIYDKEKGKQVELMEDVLEQMSAEEKKKLKKIVKRDEKREFFDNYNPRAPVSLMNADLRARRKTIKIFLAHYWMACKDIYQESLGASKPNLVSESSKRSKPHGNSESQPYVSEKLGHKHISNWKEAVEANIKAKEEKVLKSNKVKKTKIKA